MTALTLRLCLFLFFNQSNKDGGCVSHIPGYQSSAALFTAHCQCQSAGLKVKDQASECDECISEADVRDWATSCLTDASSLRRSWMSASHKSELLTRCLCPENTRQNSFLLHPYHLEELSKHNARNTETLISQKKSETKEKKKELICNVNADSCHSTSGK